MSPMSKPVRQVRQAVHKAERAAQVVLDGKTRDDLDDDHVASLMRQVRELRILADYIEAVLQGKEQE
jgi:hypothetical protein